MFRVVVVSRVSSTLGGCLVVYLCRLLLLRKNYTILPRPRPRRTIMSSVTTVMLMSRFSVSRDLRDGARTTNDERIITTSRVLQGGKNSDLILNGNE